MMLKVEGTPLEVVPHVQSSWKCEDCTPEEKYVLEQLQEHTELLIAMLLQRSWVTSNRNPSSFLISVKVVLA